MTLTNLLSGAGFCCCMLGIGGIAGALEFGTGWITSITLLVIGITCFCLFLRERGGELIEKE